MSQTDDLTANLYGVDEVLSAMQKSIRRGLDKETLFWTAELEQSGLGLLALARFGIIIPEDIGLGGPELAVDYCAVRKAYLSLLQSCDAVDEGEPLPPHAGRAQLLLAFARRLAAAPKCRMAHTAASAAPLLLRSALRDAERRRHSGAAGAASGANAAAVDAATASVLSTFESGDWALSRYSIVEALRLAKSLARGARNGASAADVQAFEQRAIAVLQRLFVERDQQCPGESKWSRDMWRAVLALKPQHPVLAQSARALHAMCHGGGCAAMRYGLFMALQLFTREPCIAPPHRTATTPIPAVTPGESHALMHRGLQHRIPVPLYAVDKHTLRGKGRRGQGDDVSCWGTDTRCRLDAAVAGRAPEVQRVVAGWSAEEVAMSHGPGRVWLRSKLRPPQAAQAQAQVTAARTTAALAPRPPPAGDAPAASRAQHSLASQFWDEGMCVRAELLPAGCACDPYFRAARECSLMAEAMHGPRGVSAATAVAEQWAMVDRFRQQQQVVVASTAETTAGATATQPGASAATGGRQQRKSKSRKARHKRVQGTSWS